MTRVVMLTRRWPSVVEEQLARQYQLILNETDLPMSPSALEAALYECDAVCPTVADVLPASFFEGRKVRTKKIGNYGVGYNHIAVEAARGYVQAVGQGGAPHTCSVILFPASAWDWWGMAGSHRLLHGALIRVSGWRSPTNRAAGRPARGSKGAPPNSFQICRRYFLPVNM